MTHSLLGLAVLACLAAASCSVGPPVCRADEKLRVEEVVASRTGALGLTPERVLSLEDCEKIALENNLEYRVKLLETKLADEDVNAAFGGLLPQGNATFRRTARNNEPLIIGTTGIPGQFDDQHTSLFEGNVLIPIFDFGATRAAWDIAKDVRAQTRLAAIRARQTLLRDVRVAYSVLLGAITEEGLLRGQLAAAREELRTARSLEREGLGTGADTAFVEATVAKSELELTSASQTVLIARAALSRSMSVPAWTEYRIATTVDVDPRPPESREDVIALEQAALRSRPELFSQDLQRHIAAAELRARFSDFFPRVGGTVDFQWSSNSKVVNPAFWKGGFVIAQSLLEGGAVIARYRKAEGTVDLEAERAVLVGMSVLYEVDLRILELIKAHDRIRSSEVLVAAQEALLARVSAGQREGLESGANLSRALADADAARRGLNNARTDLLKTWFELEAAVGSEAGIGSLLPESAPASRPPAGDLR